MQTLRIAIFDDNKDFRDSLLQLFHFSENVEVVATFPNGAEAREALIECKPDVVLMDIDMPVMNGIEATLWVRESVPDAQVMMLTVSEEEDRIFQALRNGATGYLLKKSSSEELLESVWAIHKGGSPMSPPIARKMLRFFQQDFPAPAKPTGTTDLIDTVTAGLTAREREILELLVDGYSYKMIANRLHISAETVKNHIQGIYRKLQVSSKGEAISYVLRGGNGQ
ncbi:MAG: response regulator transcription factor [Saprospiraceae bacterium]|nr:response regulator transcription factor [Saprospiraceae bacterium]